MADSDNESGEQRDIQREQDRFLPIANVSRIMKRALPANAKISKDAKETVQECVSEFISFITGEASDKCQREKRKTINGDDLLWGMTTLGFENYVDPLKVYLHKFRDVEEEKSSMAGIRRDKDATEADNMFNTTYHALYGFNHHHQNQGYGSGKVGPGYHVGAGSGGGGGTH
ncbi:nuclear transcription factor Y subunit B-3-like [Salvia hispanica]|uniref:nuclear transcription factor Y subunit B-3-like n=1 Tax=Salvia hispanica TaxID=49212 RepID=UPI002009D312|nr:nuclear transcription factor Y subunit B-3-like [Salvia hispanica]